MSRTSLSRSRSRPAGSEVSRSFGHRSTRCYFRTKNAELRCYSMREEEGEIDSAPCFGNSRALRLRPKGTAYVLDVSAVVDEEAVEARAVLQKMTEDGAADIQIA